jgi:hypothetical protein
MDDATRKLIDAIRDAVNASLEGRGEPAASLRELARQIGVVPSGLSKFARGSMPYSKTLKLLRRWYATREPSLRERQKKNAVADLLANVPAAKRAEAERVILSLVDQLEGDSSKSLNRRAVTRQGANDGN